MSFTVSKTVSDETLNCIITIESSGNPNARAGTSSALGLGQFLDATWLSVVHKHRPDLLERYTRSQVLNMRTSPSLAIELLARFTEDNQRIIGMDCTGGDLYLAHFLGTADAKDLFNADPDTPVSRLVSLQVIKANRSIMTGKTAGQVRKWAARRMAASRGHDWVAKYYHPTRPVGLLDEPQKEPETPAAIEGSGVDDIPDTQDGTAPAARPDPVPEADPAPEPTPITPEKKESFFDWVNRKRKTVASWVTGGGGGIGFLAYLTDWRVAAVIVCGLIVAGVMAYLFWLLARRR